MVIHTLQDLSVNGFQRGFLLGTTSSRPRWWCITFVLLNRDQAEVLWGSRRCLTEGPLLHIQWLCTGWDRLHSSLKKVSSIYDKSKLKPVARLLILKM